jgi:hypothetical protein
MSQHKKAISFLFIFIFCYSGLRPTLPFFNYFINYEYIAEVLCINKEKEVLACNGKCQLTKDVLENESSDNTNHLQINFEKFPTLFLENSDFVINIPISKRNTSYHFLCRYKGSSQKPLLPPPRIVTSFS